MARKEHPTDPLFFKPEDDDLSTHRHRVVIGVLGAALLLVVGVIGWLRPVDATLSVPLSSISAYYYSGAVAVFSATSRADLPRVILAQSLRVFTLVALVLAADAYRYMTPD